MIREFMFMEATVSDITVAWETDVPATGQVEYGQTEEYGLITPWSEGLSTRGAAYIEELEPMTNYHFKLRVRDAAGNETVSEDKTLHITSCSLPH